MGMFTPSLFCKTISSPVGNLTLVASARGLRAVWFEESTLQKHMNDLITSGQMLGEDDHKLLLKTEAELKEYFAGKRKQFSVPLDLQGTVFQISAWRQLQQIPYGQTISYGQQAARMGDAKKARAAGVANGRNPIGIIVPCHRVIGSDGSLTGFGGGMHAKQILLELEQRHCN